jgi:hypothetical protein
MRFIRFYTDIIFKLSVSIAIETHNSGDSHASTRVAGGNATICMCRRCGLASTQPLAMHHDEDMQENSSV